MLGRAWASPASHGHLVSPRAGPHGVIPLFPLHFPLPRPRRKTEKGEGGQGHATRVGGFPLLPAAAVHAKPRAPLRKRTTPLLERALLFSHAPRVRGHHGPQTRLPPSEHSNRRGFQNWERQPDATNPCTQSPSPDHFVCHHVSALRHLLRH
jgi:hypothetical protein